MSRLDSFIRRLTAQKACLEQCASEIGSMTGVVVELGLGNGRTFDHLREILPDREIFVLEREPRAHPGSTPDTGHLLVGSLAELLPTLGARLPGRAVLVHSDIGCGDPETDRKTTALICEHISGFLASGGFVASDQPLLSSELCALPLPKNVKEGRYHVYRRIDPER